MTYKDWISLIAPISMFASMLIAFVTVKVTQAFDGKKIEESKNHIDRLFKEKDSLSNRLTKAETQLNNIENNYVSKDELIAIKDSISHIESNLNSFGNKIDKIMDILLSRKD